MKSRLFIWGAGVIGKELQTILSLYDCFAGFIDNDEVKQYNGWNGARVYSLEEYMALSNKGIVLVAVAPKNVATVCEQLGKCGLEYYLAAEFLNETFPRLVFTETNELMIPLVQISLTERCTLKCKKCAHACYNVPMNSEDYSIENVKESADIFFSKVDKAGEFVLIGGEPLLYKNLAETIDYIGENYRERIAIFSITTNGTIIPSEDVLKLCQKYRVLIRISNYSKTNSNLEKHYQGLCQCLEEYGIDYVLGEAEHEWFDYGFGEVDRGADADLRAVFKKCKTPCREVRGNRFYYCVMARSVSENLGLGVGEDDYLDLTQVHDKKMILDYQLGKLNKGYLEMCRYCRGDDAKHFPIPAAEQVAK